MHLVKVEIGGSSHLITLENAPGDLIAKAARLQQLRNEVPAAEYRSASADANAQAARMRASSTYYVAGSRDYVGAVAREEQLKANAAAAATANARKTAAQLRSVSERSSNLPQILKKPRSSNADRENLRW